MSSAKCIEEIGPSILRFLKRQTNKTGQVMLDSRQQFDAQPKPVTQKTFKDFFNNYQGTRNKRAPNTYVPPHKQNNRYSSQSLFRNQNFTSRRKSSSYDKTNRYYQPFNNRSRSITQNNRLKIFHN